MSKKTNQPHVSPNSGRVEGDRPNHDEPATAESKATPEPQTYTAKDVAALRAEYEHLVGEVQTAAKASATYERDLLAEVKTKVIAKAGDVDALKARKREAFMKWQAADLAVNGEPMSKEAAP